MLLPNKYIPVQDTLPYLAKLIYGKIDGEMLPYALWAKVRRNESVATYERFVYALDFLYALGVIERVDSGFLRRRNNAEETHG